MKLIITSCVPKSTEHICSNLTNCMTKKKRFVINISVGSTLKKGAYMACCKNRMHDVCDGENNVHHAKILRVLESRNVLADTLRYKKNYL